jgi:hypothetical protein
MPTINDPNAPKSKWPSGMTFVMYCAGVTMVLLAVSLVISGKPFAFSVEDSKVTLHGGLMPQGVPEEKAKEKSTELQQQFTEAKLSTPEAVHIAPTEVAPFNGTWEGAGSLYELVQDGAAVILSETTDGITSAYGVGQANGNHAHLNIQTAIGTFPAELVAESQTQIKMTVSGQSYYITRN